MCLVYDVRFITEQVWDLSTRPMSALHGLRSWSGSGSGVAWLTWRGSERDTAHTRCRNLCT